jgi:hypothetical protein
MKGLLRPTPDDLQSAALDVTSPQAVQVIDRCHPSGSVATKSNSG